MTRAQPLTTKRGWLRLRRPQVKMGVVLRVALALALFGWLVLTWPRQRVREPEPGPLFAGTSLPVPPRQGQPWQEPASRLRPEWVNAMRELIRQGLADPRGCEYREVKLTCGDVWKNRGELVATHAWLIPETGDTEAATQRFAVSWSGLVYPVVEVGPLADVEADMEAILQQDRKRSGLFNTARERIFVSHGSLLPIKSCALMLLGEGDMAERLWKAWMDRGDLKRYLQENHPQDASYNDPYVLLAREWAWAQYDRAVCAHMRGDDVVSLSSAQALVAFEAAVEKTAAGRGLKPPVDINRKPQPYLLLSDPPALLAEDEASRVRSPPVERVLEAGIRKFPDQTGRIAALVRDLETINETQRSQPGGVNISTSPVVQALVKEGPPTVEPLLECLATDR